MKLYTSAMAAWAVSQTLVSSQEILFEYDISDGEFHGVYEMGGNVYASSVEGGGAHEGFLWKFSLNGEMEMKVSAGTNNMLAQIAPLGNDAIVANPPNFGVSEGVQAFHLSNLTRIWSNDVVEDAEASCPPIVADNNNNGESVVISGFRSEIFSGHISGISANGVTKWNGSQGMPCGTLSKDQQLLYTGSVPTTPQSRVVAYNVTTGEEIDASNPTDPVILDTGLALTDDGTSLFASFSSHVQQFDANDLSSTTTLTTDFPLASRGQSPIISKDSSRLYVSNGSTVLRAFEINIAQNTATRLWTLTGLKQEDAGKFYAAVSLFNNETAILVPVAGGVAAYATEDGALLWEKNLDPGFGFPTAVSVNAAENRVYVAGGKLVSIEIGDGTVSPAPTEEPSASPSMHPSASPSLRPSQAPTTSQQPTTSPQPSTAPTLVPSSTPTEMPSPATSQGNTARNIRALVHSGLLVAMGSFVLMLC